MIYNYYNIVFLHFNNKKLNQNITIVNACREDDFTYP